MMGFGVFSFWVLDVIRRREGQRIVLLAERGPGRKICYYSAVNPCALGGGSIRCNSP